MPAWTATPKGRWDCLSQCREHPQLWESRHSQWKAFGKLGYLKICSLNIDKVEIAWIIDVFIILLWITSHLFLRQCRNGSTELILLSRKVTRSKETDGLMFNSTIVRELGWIHCSLGNLRVGSLGLPSGFQQSCAVKFVSGHIFTGLRLSPH